VTAAVLADRWAVLGSDDVERGRTLIERFGNAKHPFSDEQVEIDWDGILKNKDF
jgi:hypothetical protein